MVITSDQTDSFVNNQPLDIFPHTRMPVLWLKHGVSPQLYRIHYPTLYQITFYNHNFSSYVA